MAGMSITMITLLTIIVVKLFCEDGPLVMVSDCMKFFVLTSCIVGPSLSLGEEMAGKVLGTIEVGSVS